MDAIDMVQPPLRITELGMNEKLRKSVTTEVLIVRACSNGVAQPCTCYTAIDRAMGVTEVMTYAQMSQAEKHRNSSTISHLATRDRTEMKTCSGYCVGGKLLLYMNIETPRIIRLQQSIRRVVAAEIKAGLAVERQRKGSSFFVA